MSLRMWDVGQHWLGPGGGREGGSVKEWAGGQGGGGGGGGGGSGGTVSEGEEWREGILITPAAAAPAISTGETDPAKRQLMRRCPDGAAAHPWCGDAAL